MNTPSLRPASAADVPTLAAIYEGSVRRLAPTLYLPPQVDAWAGFARDEEAFRRWILDAFTLVAEVQEVVVGFGGLRDDGLVSSLYVHPDQGRRGIASLILAALLERARALGLPRVSTHASEFSRGTFLRAGFEVDADEVVQRRGLPFRRFRMSRGVPQV